MDILLVASRYPWPARRGDQLRLLQMAELLAALGHRPRLLVPEPPAGTIPEGAVPPGTASPGGAFEVDFYRPAGRGEQILGLARSAAAGMPFQAGLFASPDLRRRLPAAASGFDLVMLQLVRLAPCLEVLESLKPKVPVAVDLIDSLALNFQQWAAVSAAPKRWLLAVEAGRLARWEGEILRRAAGALVVCERDRQAILGRQEATTGAARLGVLPLAFPLDSDSHRGETVGERERETAEPAEVEPNQPPTLALTGNLGYFVTVDGFCWWLEEVLPLLRQRIPQVRAIVAGARPARRLRRAASQPGVELIPNPPDLLSHLRRAHLALAPLRFGAGQPLKILEAWQCGVPVVASPWAAVGTTGKAGEDFQTADSPREWVEVISQLLGDPQARSSLATSARRRLRQDYGREPLRQGLGQWLDGVAAPRS